MSAAGQILLFAGALFVTLIVSAYTDIFIGKVYKWCRLPAIFVGLAILYMA